MNSGTLAGLLVVFLIVAGTIAMYNQKSTVEPKGYLSKCRPLTKQEVIDEGLSGEWEFCMTIRKRQWKL